MATKTLFTFFVLVFFTSVFCQTPKKRITEQDYHLWSSLSRVSLSNQGDWTAWQQDYPNITDSLFIKNTNNDRQYAFEKTNLLQFDEQDQYCLLRDNKEKQIILLNLNSGKQNIFKQSVNADFIFGDTYLAIEKASDSSKELILYNIIAQTETVLEQLSEYSTSFDKNRISWIDKSNTIWLNYLQGKRIITIKLLNQSDKKRKNITWSDSGNSIAVMEEQQEQYELSKAHQIYYFTDIMSGQRQTKKLDLADSPVLSKEYYVADINNFSPLQISPDEETIYFTVLKKDYQPSADNIQIWDSTADLEYPRAQNNDIGKIPKLTAWNTETGETTKLQEDDKSHFNFLDGKNFALTYSANQYDSKYNYNGFGDVYLLDVKNNSKNLLLPKYRINFIQNKINISPNQKYISYFLGRNWFMYDISNGKTINVTEKIKSDIFCNVNEYNSEECIQNQDAIWTTENTLLLKGNKNIWLYTPSSDHFKKIFISEEEFDQFSFSSLSTLKTSNNNNYYNSVQKYINIKTDLLIIVKENYSKSGFYTFNKNRCQEIVLNDLKNYSLIKAKYSDKYVYLTEDTDIPTVINFYDGKTTKVIYRINRHQENFLYPQKELISYTNSKGEQLKGILFYPTDFDSLKKYPMITHIYEKQSVAEYNEYRIPTLYNPTGFNSINYTSNGYFVFYPDITYEIGKPGYSALDCTEAGVKTVLKKGFIDSAKLGLIGHSFGGYEAAFIVTKSNLFNVVVAGAAKTNLLWDVFTIDNFGNMIQSWRYINFQMRMGKNIYDNFDGYKNNSPVFSVNQIKCKLINWCGLSDRNVDPAHSIALNMAMRIIDKKHILLAFPNEGHILSKKSNQYELSKRIENYFLFK